MKKQVIIEMVWIIGLAFLSISLTGLIIGFSNLTNWTFDFSINGSELILTSPFFLIAQTFLVLSFVAFGSRASLRKFKSTLPSYIFIIISGLLIFSTTVIIKFMPQFDIFLNGSLYSWIIYPPLSAVPRQQEISSLTITNFLTILQAFSIVMLIVSSILTGMNQRSTMHNPV
jgi:hypothetical protein